MRSIWSRSQPISARNVGKGFGAGRDACLEQSLGIGVHQQAHAVGYGFVLPTAAEVVKFGCLPSGRCEDSVLRTA